MSSRTAILAAIVIAMLAPAAQADPITREQALDAGRAFGTARKADVVDAAAEPDLTTVPGYHGTDLPEAAHRAAGVGIEDVGRQALPEHPVGRYVDEAAWARPQFRIERDDAVVERGRDIGNAPEAVLGSALTGETSGCAPTEVTLAPEASTTEHCTAWGVAQEVTCDTALNVEVERTQRCLPGTWHATYPWRGIGTEVGVQCVDAEALPFRFYPNWAHGTCDGWQHFALARAPFETAGQLVAQGRTHWKGACTFTMFLHLAPGTHGCVDGWCRYRFRITEDRWGTTDDAFTLAFVEPGYADTVTERWDDGCVTLDARAQ
ncbi:MAG: hypothetical protein H6982_16985 [Chromatiales bacterium]|nr:hypothetical protein [Chromatiales bacterium]